MRCAQRRADHPVRGSESSAGQGSSALSARRMMPRRSAVGAGSTRTSLEKGGICPAALAMGRRSARGVLNHAPGV